MLVVILSDTTSYTYLLLNISRMTGMMKVNIFVTGACDHQRRFFWKISKKYLISIREQPDYKSGFPDILGKTFDLHSVEETNVQTYCWDKLNLNLINLAE